MAAIATALLSLFYFLVDVSQKEPKRQSVAEKPSCLSLLFDSRSPVWSGAPLTFLGANPILIYVAQIVFQKYLPFNELNFVPDTHWGNLTYSIWGVGIWTLISFVLHRKQIYLSI